jgi:hypothetical protein
MKLEQADCSEMLAFKLQLEQTECSETLAFKLQMLVNHPEESI